MRIKQVSVIELFGVFDHVIPFNMDEHITIIHGSNGLGKTALLRMINVFFNNRYSELRSIPFLSWLSRSTSTMAPAFGLQNRLM